MKKTIPIILLFLTLSCQTSDKQNHINKPITIESITRDMQCENCGMNLHKYLLTNSALKFKNGESHFYCSVNCSILTIDKRNISPDQIFIIDHNDSKFIDAKNAYYVVGSKLKGTMTKASKFAFKDKEKAKIFLDTFSGKSISSYSEIIEMTRKEIAQRTD